MGNFSTLGRLVQEYKRSRKTFRQVLIISLVSLFIAALLFWGAWSGEKGWDQKIVLSILGLVISLPAVFGFYMLISRRGSSVSLYEKGLIYRRAGKEFVAAWDDIASITLSTACRIEKKDGVAFDLGANVEGFEDLAPVIEEETLKRLLPEAQARIAAGSNVSFAGLAAQGKVPMGGALPDVLVGGGTFTVDAKGITLAKDGSRIDWKDVTAFGVRQGEARRARFEFFFIEDGARTFQTNYGALPNGHLLMALCEEMISGKAA
jgi:hypothetical protein